MGTSLSTSQHTMSVELNPPELGFKRPFNEERAVSLQLTNSTAESVAFKVKTTAPKQYCVRPNSGIIRPHDHVEVQVLLQAMKEEPPLDYKCRDKFLVQSVALDSSHNPDDGLTTLWSAIEKTSKSSIQEKKIRVNFLAPGAPTPNGVSSEMEEKPPSYTATSPSPQFDSPAPQKSTVGDSARSAAEATGVAGAAAAVSSAIPTSQEELKSQLAAAQAQIAKLTQDMKDPAVRQRKAAQAQEKVQTVVQQSQSGGVPLHIVAALCLFSFLVAWLFF